MWALFAVFLVAFVFIVIVSRSRGEAAGDQGSEDLRGKVIVITGASSGIGLATSIECAKRGATVVLACRNQHKAELAKEEITNFCCDANIAIILVDLSSLKSVRKFVEDFKKQYGRLDALVNNAGYLGPQTKTEDGYDTCFQVNYLSHFLLTSLLVKECVVEKGRIINVTSDSYSNSNLDFDDLMDCKTGRYGMFASYGRSKLAVVLFGIQLNQRYADKDICAISVHPGAVKTNLLRHWPGLSGSVLRLCGKLFFRSPQQGAISIVHCLAIDDPSHLVNRFVYNCKGHDLAAMALDLQAARRLWSISLSLCGLQESDAASEL